MTEFRFPDVLTITLAEWHNELVTVSVFHPDAERIANHRLRVQYAASNSDPTLGGVWLCKDALFRAIADSRWKAHHF